MPAKTDPPTKEGYSKWDVVWHSSIDGIEMVFVLLAGVVVFYI